MLNMHLFHGLFREMKRIFGDADDLEERLLWKLIFLEELASRFCLRIV